MEQSQIHKLAIEKLQIDMTNQRQELEILKIEKHQNEYKTETYYKSSEYSNYKKREKEMEDLKRRNEILDSEISQKKLDIENTEKNKKHLDLQMKTLCNHYWIRKYCEDDYECKNCGWYKSEV